MRVSRVDITGHFDSNRRTPQGGLKVPAYLTRVGVLVYRNPDGSSTRELRHPDEVFKADSLSSLEGAPVTVGHPGKVAPENWKTNSVGHVGDSVAAKEDKYVSATLRIQDAKAVQQVERGELLELSCGYDCDTDPTPGEYNGEKYDAVQRNISYNHVALLPRGGGRAGNDVRIRFDGSTDTNMDGETAGGKLDAMSTELEKKIAELTAENAELRAKSDKRKADRKDAEDKVTALTAENEKLRGEKAGLEKQLSEAVDPVRFDAAVASAVAFRADASCILGDEIAGSKKDVMIAALKRCDATFADTGLSEDYLSGLFAAAVKGTKAGSASVAKTASAVVGAQTVEIVDPIASARARADARSRTAWKGQA